MNEDPPIPDLLLEPFWYAVRTQTRREHLAAKHLREVEGVEVLCPRLRYRKATRRGKIWWIEPLFPGYILARFPRLELERAVSYCHGVRGLVRFGDQIPAVPDAFVERIRQEIALYDQSTGDCITLQPQITTGEEVEVAHGPLQGMRGPVLEILPGKERVRVLLEFLGQPQRIEIDLFSILLPRKPLPPPPPATPHTNTHTSTVA
jgi:transcriptional antiterminator RfaH